MQFLNLGETVDIIFINSPSVGNEDGFFGAMHPMHIHGHYFWSIASGDGEFDKELALNKANFVNPPLRDNVVVSSSSWVWVRLEASNPGLWLMHCHSETHAVFGMMTTLVVGTADERHVPSELVQCGGVTSEIMSEEGNVAVTNGGSAASNVYVTDTMVLLVLVMATSGPLLGIHY